MKALTFLSLFLVSKVEAAFPWTFINAFDKNVLDWMDYTVFQIDSNVDLDLDQLHFDSFLVFNDANQTNHHHHTLKIRNWNISQKVKENQNCNETRGKFVKDPNYSFLIYDETFDPNSNLGPFNCILPLQPYLYVLTKSNGFYLLYELQVYSNSVYLIGKSSWDNSSAIEYSHPDVFARRKNFKGTTVITMSPKSMNLMLDLFELFQAEFNFTPVFDGTVYGQPNKDGSWTGSIGKLMTLEHDLAANDFSFIPERLAVVSPSSHMYKVSRIVVYRSDSNSVGSWNGLFKVLATEFWLAILVSMLTFFVIFVLSIRFTMKGSKIFLSILNSATLIVQAFLGQGFEPDFFIKTHVRFKETFTLQLQLLSFIGAMVFWVYSGCLISFFTFSSDQPPIRYVKDLVNEENFKFYVYNGSTLTDIKNALNSTEAPNCIETIDDRYDGKIEEMVAKDADKQFGVIMESAGFTQILHDYGYDHCNFGTYKLPELKDTRIGWLFPNNSILIRFFNRFMLEHTQNGVIHRLQDRYFKSRIICSIDSFNSIDFQTVTALFVLLTVGVILSVITFGAEKAFLNGQQQNQPSRNVANIHKKKSRSFSI